MSRFNRAQKLNARAVEKINYAMAMARLNSQLDISKIISDVLSGKSAATLNRVTMWDVLAYIILFIGIILASYNKVIAIILFCIWLLFSVLIPIFTVIGNWFSSIQSFSFSSQSPKCEVSGCDNSATYVLNPSGRGEINLCYNHKDKLECRIQYAPYFDPKVAKSVILAYKYLVRAAKLDSTSAVIQENLKHVHTIAEIVLERKLE
jgi:hypothetical protein